MERPALGHVVIAKEFGWNIDPETGEHPRGDTRLMRFRGVLVCAFFGTAAVER